MSDKLTGHIAPDRIHRFVSDEDDDQYIQVIPGPNSSAPVKSGEAATTKTKQKEKK